MTWGTPTQKAIDFARSRMEARELAIRHQAIKDAAGVALHFSSRVKHAEVRGQARDEAIGEAILKLLEES